MLVIKMYNNVKINNKSKFSHSKYVILYIEWKSAYGKCIEVS